MSCDTSRASLFDQIGVQLQVALGRTVPGEELLEMVYDVARNREPPQRREDQLAALGRYVKLRARAEGLGINLYPHNSKNGLPPLRSVAAWAEVGALIDALESRGPLPSLGADVARSLIFQQMVKEENTPWNIPMEDATRQRLREIWAENPAALAAALIWPPASAGEEFDPLLRGVWRLLLDDPRAPLAFRLGEEQYGALLEVGQICPEDRGAWMRALARAVGLGFGSGEIGAPGTAICFRCGLRKRAGHACDEEDARVARDAIIALAPLLTAHWSEADDPYRYSCITDLAGAALEPMFRAGGFPQYQPDPADPEAAALDAARALDQRIVARTVARPGFARHLTVGDTTWLRDATRRAPLDVGGVPCVWERGCLYPYDTFRQRADWSAAASALGRMMPDESGAICAITAADLLRAMDGKRLPPSAISPRGAAPSPTWPRPAPLAEGGSDVL